MGRLADTISVQRILFGSYAPVFYFEAARLKMRESLMTEEQTRDILRENARRAIA